jgi:hypothetical protein
MWSAQCAPRLLVDQPIAESFRARAQLREEVSGLDFAAQQFNRLRQGCSSDAQSAIPFRCSGGFGEIFALWATVSNWPA